MVANLLTEEEKRSILDNHIKRVREDLENFIIKTTQNRNGGMNEKEWEITMNILKSKCKDAGLKPSETTFFNKIREMVNGRSSNSVTGPNSNASSSVNSNVRRDK